MMTKEEHKKLDEAVSRIANDLRGYGNVVATLYKLFEGMEQDPKCPTMDYAMGGRQICKMVVDGIWDSAGCIEDEVAMLSPNWERLRKYIKEEPHGC